MFLQLALETAGVWGGAGLFLVFLAAIGSPSSLAFCVCSSLMMSSITSVLQPLDVSINKPFKSYIRQCWCERMVSEAETSVAKITPASKDVLMGWIKTAADQIKQNTHIIKKSFEVTGIVKKPDCTRSDALYKEIQDVMVDVFGPDHMGYVEIPLLIQIQNPAVNPRMLIPWNHLKIPLPIQIPVVIPLKILMAQRPNTPILNTLILMINLLVAAIINSSYDFMFIIIKTVLMMIVSSHFQI